MQPQFLKYVAYNLISSSKVANNYHEYKLIYEN